MHLSSGGNGRRVLPTHGQPPDLANIQATGSDYTLQKAILKALEEKVRLEERRQSLGTSEALRLMQEVE